MNEFTKRLFTSLVILIPTFFIIFYGGFLFIIFLAIIFLLTLYEWLNLCENKIILFLGIAVLISSFSAMLYLRKIDLYLLLFIMIISISSDIGGYMFGKFFKGPKLTKISPNKTYSGMIGSYVFTLSIGTSYILYSNSLLIIPKIDYSLFEIVLIMLILSSINQIGDIILSYFKRLKKVKDTGRLLPGHGGLLDRIDGLIFSILAGYLLKILII
jgi:phosphatidate cytidylyltransferase